MLSRSLRFKQLQAELRELRLHFLPKDFSPIGSYSLRILSRTIGYRVLAHAEIESYLEDRSVEVATAALRNWKANKYIGRTSICLIAFIGRMMEDPPSSFSPEQPTQISLWDNKLHLDRKLEHASRVFHQAIRDNHGVKEANILRLLLPVGIDANDLDPVWLSTMNTFGKLRGEAAHTSRTKWKTSQPPDPESEYNTVIDIVVGLRKIDESLNKLL